MKPSEVKFTDGVVGFFQDDPGDGRFLWSVRFPAHSCYRVTGKSGYPLGWHCEVGEEYETHAVRQSFRHGKAKNEAEAMKAIREARDEGRPNRSNVTGQFVKA